MITLKKLELSSAGDAVAHYEVSFQVNPGTREGSTVTLDLKMQTSGGATVITGDFGECLSTTPEAGMDKLAFWFENFAKELRERKLKTDIPIYKS